MHTEHRGLGLAAANQLSPTCGPLLHVLGPLCHLSRLSYEQSQKKAKKYFIVIAEHKLQMQFSFNQKCNKSSNVWRIVHIYGAVEINTSEKYILEQQYATITQKPNFHIMLL